MTSSLSAHAIFKRMGLKEDVSFPIDNLMIWAGIAGDCAPIYQEELKELFGIEIKLPETRENYCAQLNEKKPSLRQILQDINDFENIYHAQIDTG